MLNRMSSESSLNSYVRKRRKHTVADFDCLVSVSRSTKLTKLTNYQGMQHCGTWLPHSPVIFRFTLLPCSRTRFAMTTIPDEWITGVLGEL